MLNAIPVGIWFISAIPALGIVGALLARAGEGSQRYGICLSVFFLCLVLVSAMTMLFLRLPSGLGLVAGFTLGVMLIGTTCDFGRASRATS